MQTEAAPLHTVGAHKLLLRVAVLCAALLILLGMAVLLGWGVQSEPLMTMLPGHQRMKPNAAVCFLAAGIALLALAKSLPAWARLQGLVASVFSVAVLAVALPTLLEYVSGADLGMDQWLFRDTHVAVYPGRMAPITALCFSLGAMSLLLKRGGRVTRQLGQGCALVLSLAAFAAMVGYLYGVPMLYGAMRNSAMALHTGAGLLVFGVGLLLVRPESHLLQVLAAPERGAWLGRRLLPPVIMGPVMLGWVYLRPAVDFGQVRFAMALFAVTLTVAMAGTLWFAALSLNRRERQKAEFAAGQELSAQQIARSERELRLVTDRLPVLLSYLDRSGRFQRVNRTYESWLGLSASQLLGKTLAEVLGQAYAERSREAREGALRGEEKSLETSYPTLRGERQARVTYAPDIDGEGQVRGLVCMVQDIEDQRRAEFALRQNEKLAVVGRMASSIAHEINNPLEALTNLLYLAGSSVDNASEAAQYIAVAESELQRVSQIVTETLRFHRQSTVVRLCRISDVIEQVLVLQQRRLLQAKIAVERRYRDDVEVECHDGEIRQVLANLIGNAIDAMPDGGRLMVRTRIGDVGEERGITVMIADTGHGIGPGTRRTLFEPFHTTKGEQGSGLGLWISKDIVARHRGRIVVRSRQRPGRHGTAFRVVLPLGR